MWGEYCTRNNYCCQHHDEQISNRRPKYFINQTFYRALLIEGNSSRNVRCNSWDTRSEALKGAVGVWRRMKETRCHHYLERTNFQSLIVHQPSCMEEQSRQSMRWLLAPTFRCTWSELGWSVCDCKQITDENQSAISFFDSVPKTVWHNSVSKVETKYVSNGHQQNLGDLPTFLCTWSELWLCNRKRWLMIYVSQSSISFFDSTITV